MDKLDLIDEILSTYDEKGSSPARQRTLSSEHLSSRVAAVDEEDDNDNELVAHVTAIEHKHKSPAPMPIAMQMGGFTTAKGLSIPVKQEAIDAVRKRFDLDDEQHKQQQQQQHTITDATIPVSFGFKTAKGGSIAVKKELVDSFRKRFDEDESTSNESASATVAPPQLVSGFKTAKGGQIAVKKELIDSMQKRLDLDEPLSDDKKIRPASGTVPSFAFGGAGGGGGGFTTAKGGHIAISKEALEAAKARLLSDVKEDDKSEQQSNSKASSTSTITSGFQTGGGKALTIDKSKFELMLQRHAEDDVEAKEEEKQAQSESVVVNQIQADARPPLTTVTAAASASASGGGSLLMSRRSMSFNSVDCAKAATIAPVAAASSSTNQKLFKRHQIVKKPSPADPAPAPAPAPVPPPLVSSSSIVMTDELSAATSPTSCSIDEQIQAEMADYFATPLSSKPAVNNSQPISYLNVKTIEITESSSSSAFRVCRPILEVASVDRYSDLNELLDIELSRSTRRPSRQVRSGEERIPLETAQKIYGAMRARAYQSQSERLGAKRSLTLTTSERCKPGYLLSLKKTRTAMMTMKTTTTTTTHGRFSLQQHLKPSRVNASNVARMRFDNCENIGDFKFNLLQYDDDDDDDDYVDDYSSERSRDTYIKCLKRGFMDTHDNGALVCNDDFTLGINEFYNCLLDSNGVDAKLVDIAWTRNHYKWIVWKLAAYDMASSTSRWLTPRNVAAQLKYRYDMEIGGARRSCLRRLMERDDTSNNKLICLVVSRIFNNNNNSTGTDGSTAVSETRTADSSMCFIELCDGWYAIRALCDTYLAECVRKKRLRVGDKLAIFSSELVGCPKDGCAPLEAPEQMHLRLSVNATRRCKWFVKLGYMRAQRVLAIKLNTAKINASIGAIDVYVERIYPILFLEKKDDGSKIFRNEKQEQLQEMDACRSHFAANGGGDEDDDSNESKKRLQPAPMNKRNVSQIVRIRVVDAQQQPQQPSDTAKRITYVITVWQNASDLCEKLREGHRFLLMNVHCTSSKASFQELAPFSLSTTRQTCYLFYKSNTAMNSTRQNCEYSWLLYSNQRIANSYGEVDLIGIVLMHAANGFHQLVYVTDASSNNKENTVHTSIVCICFPKNVEFYGYKDVLKYGQPLVAINMRVTRKKELNKYPCLFASEASVFTQRITAYKHLGEKFKELSSFVADQNGKMRLRLMLAALEQESFATSTTPLVNDTAQHVRRNTYQSTYDMMQSSRVIPIDQMADIAPLVSKSGIKTPGLSVKSSSSLSSTASVNQASRFSLSTLDNRRQGLSVKRASDVSVENFDNKTREQTVTTAGGTLSEDEDDDILQSHDLEALFSANSSFVSCKRKKL